MIRHEIEIKSVRRSLGFPFGALVEPSRDAALHLDGLQPFAVFFAQSSGDALRFEPQIRRVVINIPEI